MGKVAVLFRDFLKKYSAQYSDGCRGESIFFMWIFVDMR